MIRVKLIAARQHEGSVMASEEPQRVEVRSARESAEAERKLWDAALAHLEQGILVADALAPDYPIVLVSPSFTRITGYATEEVLGKNCRFLQGAETSPTAVAELRSALEDGRATTVEILNYRKNGQPFWNEVSLAPLRDEAGRITHVVGLRTTSRSGELENRSGRRSASRPSEAGRRNRTRFQQPPVRGARLRGPHRGTSPRGRRRGSRDPQGCRAGAG
jgi:PAS domain S-box-containing protein